MSESATFSPNGLYLAIANPYSDDVTIFDTIDCTGHNEDKNEWCDTFCVVGFGAATGATALGALVVGGFLLKKYFAQRSSEQAMLLEQ